MRERDRKTVRKADSDRVRKMGGGEVLEIQPES